jgi:tetratricopeptide (TPR) repeat protein
LNGYAQSPEAIKLQQQILQHPQQDTFRANRLNDLSVRTSMSFDGRDSAASEALAISKKLDYSKGILNALRNLSTIKSAQGEIKEAMSLLRQAYNIAEKEKDKVTQVIILQDIGYLKEQTNEGKTAIDELLKAEAIAKELPDKKLLASCQRAIGGFYYIIANNYPLAMEWILKSMKTSEEANCASCLENSWYSLGNIYSILGDQGKALLYFQKVMDANKSNGVASSSTLLNSIGERYRLMGKYPEAIKSYEEALAIDKDPYNTELYESNLADVYVRMDSLPLAFHYAFSSLKGAEKLKDVTGVAWIDGILARVYVKKNMADSALYYAKNGLNIAVQSEALEFMRDNSEALANAYLQKKDFENAYKYNTLFISYRDSMLNENVSNQAHLLQYNFNKEKTQAQIDALNHQKENQRNFLIVALVVLALIILGAILLFRNNRQKQKANILLHRQKEEIDAKANELAVQKEHLEQSYNNVELLGEIGRKITSSLSMEKIMGTVYDHVNSLMDASVFGIGIYNDDLSRIEFPATYEEGEALPFYYNSIEAENSFAVKCFKGGK